jgi:hypothetical protein
VVITILPEVKVEKESVPEVLLHPDAPPDTNVAMPEVFPILVAPVDDVFIFKIGAVIAAVPDARVWVNPVSPVELIEPEVEVRLSAPVDCVKPLEAVSVWVDVSDPLLVVRIPVLPIEIEVAVVVPILVAAAESNVKAPDVTVVILSAPEVLVHDDVPPDASTSVPVLFPTDVAEVPVVLMFVVPRSVVEPFIALVPVAFPMVFAADDPVPKVLVSDAPVAIVEAALEVRVVNDPAPAEIDPEPTAKELNVAAPAPVIDHWASFKARSVLVDLPMVIVPVLLPVPMLVLNAPDPLMVAAPTIEVVPESVKVSRAEPIPIVSATVLSVPTAMVLPADPPIVTMPVEVPVAMFTALFDEALRLTIPPLTVIPDCPVRSPADVIVPLPVVEIVPVVVRLPEEFTDHAVPPTRDRVEEPLLLPMVTAFIPVPAAILTVWVFAPVAAFPILMVFDAVD